MVAATDRSLSDLLPADMGCETHNMLLSVDKHFFNLIKRLHSRQNGRVLENLVTRQSPR